MNTHRETILQAVMMALSWQDPVAGHLYRSRQEALSRGELPAIVVKPGAEEPQVLARGLVQRAFDIHIEVHARGTPADAIADPVLAAVHFALMADETLGGTVARLIEKGLSEPEFADGDETAVQITATYTAIYPTTTGDITRRL